MAPGTNLTTLWTGNLSIWLIIAFVAFVLGRYICLSFTSPLWDIPTIHCLAAWTRYYNLYIKFFYSIREAHYDTHTCQYHGHLRPVIRVGPREVSVMTTEGVKTAFGGGFERTHWYSVFFNFG